MIYEEALYQVYVPLRFTFSTHVTQCRLYSGRFSFCGEDCVLGQQGINAQTIRSALAQVISLSLRFDFFSKKDFDAHPSHDSISPNLANIFSAITKFRNKEQPWWLRRRTFSQRAWVQFPLIPA